MKIPDFGCFSRCEKFDFRDMKNLIMSCDKGRLEVLETDAGRSHIPGFRAQKLL